MMLLMCRVNRTIDGIWLALDEKGRVWESRDLQASFRPSQRTMMECNPYRRSEYQEIIAHL